MPTQKTQILARDPSQQARMVECDAQGHLYTSPVASTVWTIQFQSDEAPNDNDKVITVPNGRVWHILAIRVEYTSDANAGNRQLCIRFRDAADDVMWEVRPDLVQAASLTYFYNFGPSMGDLDAVRDTDWISTPIPPGMILPGRSDIHVYDNNNISATDTVIVHLTIGSRAV